MLKETGDDLLLVGDVLLILGLLLFEGGDELVNLLLFLVEDLVFLLVTVAVLLVVHVRCDFFDVSLVGVDDLSRFG